MQQPLEALLEIRQPSQPVKLEKKKKSLLPWLAMAVILLISAWLRLPLISDGLPYLYEEDEGHHFNRVVQMTKSGDFHPHYFLKPALHFYLRLPITGLAFLKGVEQGHLRKLGEVKTKNPYGLGGYEYTASHPILMKYNRAFSLAIALATIVVTAGLCFLIAGPTAGILAGAFLGLAPLHYEYSTHVGVDMLMSFFVASSALLAVLYLRNNRLPILALSAVCAGLAVASKYNAFWVALIPLAAALLIPRRRFEGLALMLLIPIAFICGAPFTVLDYPAFLDGAAYEVWHYKHSHPAPAGAKQALFYANFLTNSALGWGLCIAALAGILTAAFKLPLRVSAVLLIFPISYFYYMSSQQLNFTRNMLVMLPFLCVYAAYFFVRLGDGSRVLQGLLAFCAVAAAWQPAAALMSMRSEVPIESREIARPIIEAQPAGSLALAGELLFPHELRKNSYQFSIDKFSISDIWNRGYDLIVIPSYLPLPNGLKTDSISGVSEPQRIVENPALSFVYVDNALRDLSLSELREKGTDSTPALQFDPKADTGFQYGWGDVEEDEHRVYRWMKGRYASFVFVPETKSETLELNVFSPWKGQTLEVIADGKPGGIIELEDRTWKTYRIPASGTRIELIASRAGVPALRGQSPDRRQLGVAISELAIK